MKTVDLAGFVSVLRAMPSAVRKAEKHGLEEGAKLIEHEAKDLIGTEYPGWPALADSTVERKEAKGQTGRISSTDPLFATGELRATISHQVEAPVALIGTPDPVGIYQEMGTSRIPPRPFLGAAASRKGKDAAKEIGKAVHRAIIGETIP